VWRTLLIASVVMSGSANAQSPQWPMFRGENASGLGEGSAPIRWNAGTNEGIAWKTAIPGIGHSSPVIWGDLVFITTAVSSDSAETFTPAAARGASVAESRPQQSWRIYCLDRQSGRIVWQRTAHEGVPKIGRHAKASHANATPATNGRQVVAFFGSEGLFAYSLDGKPLWSRDLGIIDVGYVGQPEYQWSTASSPLLYDGLVIIQADAQQGSFVAAFDVESGREVWRQRRDELPSWSTPVIAGAGSRAVLVTNSPKFIRGLDPRTGRELWRVADGAEVKVPTPVAAQDIVVVSGGAPRGRQFYGIRPAESGDRRNDEVDRLAWTVEKGGPYTPTPIVTGDLLFVLADNGVLRAFEVQSGRLLHQARVPETGGAYSASPVSAAGVLYLTSEDGEIHVVRAESRFELIATNAMGEILMATPAIGGGMLIVRGAQHVFGVRGSGSGKVAAAMPGV